MSNPLSKNDSHGSGQVTRRQFLGTLIALFGAFWSAMAAYPIFRYLSPPKSAGQAPSVSSVVVGPVGDIPVGTGRNFQFGNIPAILVHGEEGEFHAFNAICTHLGCTVQYREDMDRIWCACHGGQYDPVTGDNLAGPPPRPLAELKAVVQDGNVVVSKA